MTEPQADGDGFAAGVTTESTAERATDEPRSIGAESLRDGIAGRLAHALNNPLGYALANLTFAIDRLRAGSGGTSGPPEELLSALSEALDGAERVRRTVNDLLASARSSASASDSRPLDLRTMVDAAVTVLAADLSGLALVRSYGPVPRVIASSGGLMQVFSSILWNLAHAQARAATTVQAQLEIHIRPENERVVVELASSLGGLGALLASSSGPARQAGAASVGLGACSALVGELGGTLEARSRPGGGTSFLVSWPAEAAPVAARVEPAVAAEPALAQRRLSIVVIDDEELITRVVERILRTEHQVVCFVNPSEALAHLESGAAPDLVLCDLMMPEITGMELFERVRATMPQLIERIVFLSGGASSSRARAFLEQVPNTRLAKPFTAAALRALVRERASETPASAP